MSSIFKALTLSSNDQATVDRTIREHNFGQLDAMVKKLANEGINLSRSSLHRYAKRLRQWDGVRCPDENVTVVVVMSRATGRTETILTPASAEQVGSAVRKLVGVHVALQSA